MFTNRGLDSLGMLLQGSLHQPQTGAIVRYEHRTHTRQNSSTITAFSLSSPLKGKQGEAPQAGVSRTTSLQTKLMEAIIFLQPSNYSKGSSPIIMWFPTRVVSKHPVIGVCTIKVSEGGIESSQRHLQCKVMFGDWPN